MRLRVLLGFVAAANACDPQQDGRWIPRKGEDAAEVAQVLGIGVDKLEKANGGKKLNMIYAGNTYTVPYVPSLTPPATWNMKAITTGTESGCLAYLELGPSSTFTTQTRTSSKSGAPSSSTERGSSPSPSSSASAGGTAPGKDSASETTAGKDSSSETASGKDAQSSKPVGSGPTRSLESTSTKLAATSEVPSATGCASSPAPSPTSGSEPLCAIEGIAYRRGTIAEHKQAQLADVFCKEDRDQLSRTNPGKLAYYFWPTREKDTAYYFYSLHWTGWDPSCPAHETAINTVRCIDMMKQNYMKCNNGGIGGITKVGCIIYEFRGFVSEKYPPYGSVTRSTAAAGSSTAAQSSGAMGATTPHSSITPQMSAITGTTTPTRSA